MCSKLPSCVLLELPDITDCINYPLKSAQRIKYTCFDISKSLIAFGATSGGIYIFNRTPCEFIQLIPNKDGAITRITISQDETHVGFANGKGTVAATECDQSSTGSSPVTSQEHHGNEVTAMVWSGTTLFAGDDVGKISVLQLPNFIAKTMFQSTSQTIMSLDSRICQLDVRGDMLLVSTLSRGYICDTGQEQYRQIGQKLRDGDYGACFVDKDKHMTNGTHASEARDYTEVRKYNIVDDVGSAFGAKSTNAQIICARPSSRLWEASIDGSVKRTHQFKQVLGRNPFNLITHEDYNKDNVTLTPLEVKDEGKSVNFTKLYSMSKAIFSFKRDVLYFLNLDDVDETVWFDTFKDIVDCKVYHDALYAWLSDGSLKHLKYLRIDKFLLKCYLDEKFKLCADMCALYNEHLLSNTVTPKLHILSGLREKLPVESIKNIEEVLLKIDNLKPNEATQLKSGIYVVDNTYQTLLDDDHELNVDSKFSSLQPDALLALKGISSTVTDKITTSKKILKEKWDDLEGMLNLGEKQTVQELQLPKRIPRVEDTSEYVPIILDSEIIYKESSQKAIEIDNNSVEKVCKALYQYFILSLVGKEEECADLVTTVQQEASNITEVHRLMLQLEQYCLSISAVEDSKFVPNNIFLKYLNLSPNKTEMLDAIIEDDVLYKYFVDSCISVNLKSQVLSKVGCECGFPLPNTTACNTPAFSELIDEFIERQWSTQTRNQCYKICKRMPYLWRKILHLRRNEDLTNILRILLQMLDENLLHSFLPQFTLDVWERTVQLYAVLHADMCLNCSKKFDHISVKDTLSWDALGALMIKSVGGRRALKLTEKQAHLIEPGALTIKFYHTGLLVALYEKIDATLTSHLTDTLYASYEHEDARLEICKLLRSTLTGQLKNTALPIIIAAQSRHWGIKNITNADEKTANLKGRINSNYIIENLCEINNGVTDCSLCGLPLQNEVLIQDGGLWVFKCGHIFHGACLELVKVKLCPSCAEV